MDKKFFWGMPDQEKWVLAGSIEEAHGEARTHIDEEFDQGEVAEYEVGEVVPALVAEDSRYTRTLIAERVIEQLDKRAADNSGAEDETFDLSKEEVAELGDLIMNYVLSKANHQWFTSKRDTVTQYQYAAGAGEALIERCAEAAEAENLGDVEREDDEAYNIAVKHCASAIRELKNIPT